MSAPAGSAGPSGPAVPAPVQWAADPGGWQRLADHLAQEARRLRPRVVFLGDSITQAWVAEGQSEWSARFAPLPAANLGIGGDRTQNLLWRILHGAQDGLNGVLDDMTLELAVVLIGVNNLWQEVQGCGTERVAEGVAAVVHAVRAKLPDARVLALGILPTQADPRHPLRAIVREVNARSAATLPTPDGAIQFLDIGARFVERDGAISAGIMPDGCHLSARGYQIFADAIEPVIREMLRPRPQRLDLTQVSFSRAGSYLAFSLRDADEARPWEQRPGEALYLRTVRGDRETNRVFRVETLSRFAATWEPGAMRVEAAPHYLRLHTPGGVVEIILNADTGARFRGRGLVGLRLTAVRAGGYGNAQPYDRTGRWLVNAWAARMNYLLTPLVGQLIVDAPAALHHAHRIAADFLPDEEADGFEGLLEEFLTEHDPAVPPDSFDQQAARSAAAFNAFRAQPPVPADFCNTADLMAYVQWSALVAPDGHLRRPAMLMSKNHLTNVWSWDHCFNALALMPHDPVLDWDQFRLPFDHQDAAGGAAGLYQRQGRHPQLHQAADPRLDTARFAGA